MLTIAAVVWCVGVAGAQSPEPTGMVCPSNPVLFTHDGLPDGNGDLAGGVEYFPTTAGPGLVAVNFGNVNCNGSPIFRALAEAMPAGGPVNEFSAGSGMVMISELDSSDAAHPRPIGADYAVDLFEQPGRYWVFSSLLGPRTASSADYTDWPISRWRVFRGICVIYVICGCHRGSACV